MTSNTSYSTKTCPKCVPMGGTYPYHHIHQMVEQPFHPNYHLKDERGFLLPWKDEFTEHPNAVQLPKMYVCLDCGYTEWYHISQPKVKEESP